MIVLVLARRGPSYDGIPDDDEDDEEWEEDMDLDLISSSKRSTIKQFMEE